MPKKAKDATEKKLLNYNEVFADILNVFLFQGRQVVDPKLLRDKAPYNYSVSADTLSSQERDIVKYYGKSKLQITSVFGLENFTAVDRAVSLRLFGYDGADYLDQYHRAQKPVNKMSEEEKRTFTKKQGKNYLRVYFPVFSFVLYFGDTKWPEKRKLSDVVTISEDFKPFFHDYEPQIFQVSFLTPDEVKLFRSDFRFVADYFVQKRLNKGKPQKERYMPSEEEMKHVRDVLMLLEAVTGDAFFAPYKENEKQFKGVKSMKGYLDCVKQKSVQQGKQQGVIIGYVNLVKKKMAKLKCTPQEAMDLLDIEDEYRPAVLEQLNDPESAIA